MFIPSLGQFLIAGLVGTLGVGSAVLPSFLTRSSDKPPVPKALEVSVTPQLVVNEDTSTVEESIPETPTLEVVPTTLKELFSKEFKLLDSSSSKDWDRVISVNKSTRDKAYLDFLKQKCASILDTKIDSLDKESLEEKKLWVGNHCATPIKVKEKITDKEVKVSIYNSEAYSSPHFWKRVLDSVKAKNTNYDMLYNYCHNFLESDTLRGELTPEELDWIRFCTVK